MSWNGDKLDSSQHPICKMAQPAPAGGRTPSAATRRRCACLSLSLSLYIYIYIHIYIYIYIYTSICIRRRCECLDALRVARHMTMLIATTSITTAIAIPITILILLLPLVLPQLLLILLLHCCYVCAYVYREIIICGCACTYIRTQAARTCAKHMRHTDGHHTNVVSACRVAGVL